MSIFLYLASWTGEAFVALCGIIIAVVALIFLAGSARWLLTAWFSGLRNMLGIEYEDEYKGGNEHGSD